MSSSAVVYSPDKHHTVRDFEASDAYKQFRQEMSATLDHLKEFAAKHVPYEAEDIKTCVDRFQDRLFNLERNYYSDARVAFYAEGKRAFDLLHRLLQNDDIELSLRTSAMRNVAGELGVCGPGLITKLITEVNRLCNTNGGLLSASWQLKHDIIEQCITDYVRKHRTYRPGNEVHEVSAFKNYGAERLGISAPSDPFAPRDVKPEQLEACIKLVEDYVSPSRLALVMAERYQQIYVDRLSDETEIARDQLTRGVEYDNDVIVETANRIVRELASTYGADTVKESSASILEFDDAGDNPVIRVPTDPALLARDILRAQHEAGLVDASYKEGELILGWNEPGTGLKVEIRHNDELLVWATVGGQVEPLTVAHLAQFPKRELEKLQAQQPKLTAALRCAVIDHAPAEALMNLPPQWLALESCAPFLSKLNDEQAIAYLKANSSDLTLGQQRKFATVVAGQQRLPLLDHVGSWCAGASTAQFAMANWLREALSDGNAQAVTLIGPRLLHGVANTTYDSLSPEQVLYNLLSANGRSSSLYSAMAAGYDKAVQAFLDIVLRAGAAKQLSATDLANLLSAKSKNDASGLDRARKNGHVDVVNTYLQAVMNAYWDKLISPEQCVELGVDAAHLAQVSKRELETLQAKQPELTAALGRAVLERESAEALMNFPLQWLPPESCPLFLSRLNDEQAKGYFETWRSDLTVAQNVEFMKAVRAQHRPPNLLEFFVKGPPGGFVRKGVVARQREVE
ncbi:hypothetical protein CFB82_40865 [Burkholderia sp. HI2714]|nr:hypothetical protein CFB82_40865 [Burkholderia sp. HI2714]